MSFLFPSFVSDRVEPDQADLRFSFSSLVDQIEFATVILLNKTDVVGKEDVARVRGIVEKLNPTAKIIETVRSRVDLKEILSESSLTYGFDSSLLTKLTSFASLFHFFVSLRHRQVLLRGSCHRRWMASVSQRVESGQVDRS